MLEVELPRINLVVVGHKDHGKSTLIGRLLYDSNAIPEQKLKEIKEELKSAGKSFEFAFILDSLEEERTGGLTIDIMQTPFKSKKYFYTIIDCPGHKEFIQKMLTGASQADAAVLVASAKEGIQDQTREHLFLVKMLGIKHLVVAANKMDLLDYDEESFRRFSRSLEEMLTSLGYAGVPIVPVSAFEGENVTKPSEKMEWYTGKSLIETLDETVKPPKPLSEKPTRCVVQDIYRIEEQNVVVCRVETGRLRTGQAVTVMPIAEKGIVEKIESFGETVTEAGPGDSVGVVLKETSNLKRGYVLASSEEKLLPTKRLDAKCKVQRILEKIDAVSLTVVEEKPKSLENGEVGKIVLQPVEPLYVEEYSAFPELGRFVIIGKKGAAAAGIILEKS
ncbi:elongation factor 1-alpha [Candidatus Bathyarchaeota archaeon ex4484_231]|nr:MAG: elongation factor 1-alpha [Candidatus Bathyarchaeota archaeon ex4484_231]